MADKIRVLIVDDSALARRILSVLLNSNPKIDVVGTATDGSFVLQKINDLHPDVITLDVVMYLVGGLEILPEIIKNYQLPVIMVSAHTQQGAESTLKALELGAVDFVTKPKAAGVASVQDIGEELAQKIIAVAGSKILKRSLALPSKTIPPVASLAKSKPTVALKTKPKSVELIAIGASTGGTEAIKAVLTDLPNTLPGILIVQHMPPGFTRTFSDRLNSLCQIFVKEAEDGDEIAPGTALVAPGSHHVEVWKQGGQLKVRLLDSAPVNRHKPSVDVMYHSVVNQLGNRSMAILLTGMGDDGARGLKAICDTGAVTVAQDEDTCVVFGMPKEAIKRGGASYVLPLHQIPGFIQLVLKQVQPPEKLALVNGG